MGRRESREILMCLAFESEYRGRREIEDALGNTADSGEVARVYGMLSDREDAPKAPKNIDGADMEYINRTFRGVFASLEEIDEKIAAASVKWKSSRISKISMAILRIAVYEMLHSEDVDVSVAINEAVELSKKYDKEDAYTFVNGVLGAIARTVEKEKGAAGNSR